MDRKKRSYRFNAISAYLGLAIIYLLLFTPIYYFSSENLMLPAVHAIDLAICGWAAYYLWKTGNIGPPSLALCAFAYLTVVAVIATGGFAGTGPFLILPYIPFVAFLSGDQRSGIRWLAALFITLCAMIGLELAGFITLPLEPLAFAIYTFLYLLTILLLYFYMLEKQHADNEIAQKSLTLKLKNQKLRQLNEAKDNFTLLASHQLRTPATAVKQYLGMLMAGYAGAISDRQHEFVKIGYESNERQLRIVDDLLMVARIDAGKIKLRVRPTDIVLLTQDIVAEHLAIFKSRNQKVVEHYPDKLPLIINIDGERLRMAISNLVDNASKYSGRGRSVTVEIKPGKGIVAVAVSDEGVGIRKADRAKLFKKFSRIDNPMSVEAGGSGLGLYWTKEIVKLHGGKISVRSKNGHGSTFEISLPMK